MPYPETTVPKFGDWDGNEDLSFSIVFDKARADKERFLPTFKEDPKDTSLHQQTYKAPGLTVGRRAPNTLLNKTMETGNRGSVHNSPKLSARHAGRMPDEQRNIQVDPSNLSDRGSGYSSSKPSSGQPPISFGLTKAKEMGFHSNGSHAGAPHEALHGRGQRIPGTAMNMHHEYAATAKVMRSKGSSETSSIADRPEKIVVPKFGEWDASDAKAGDGFTVIFDRARDEKKSNTTRKTPARIISPLQPAEDLYKDSQTHRKKGGWRNTLCCMDIDD